MNQTETLAKFLARLNEEFETLKPVGTLKTYLPNTVTYDSLRTALADWEEETGFYVGEVNYYAVPNDNTVKVVVGVATTDEIYRQRFKYQ